jgi:putative nucleotidyltransferase with HDIG domain
VKTSSAELAVSPNNSKASVNPLRIIEGWFSRERYESIEVLKKFQSGAAETSGLETVTCSLVNAVANGLASRGVYLLLPSQASGGYATYMYAGQRSRGRLYFSTGSPLVITLLQQETVIDRRGMEMIPSLIGLAMNDRRTLADNDIELMAPLKNAGHLAGILLVGRKISDEAYSRKEKRLLQSVAARVAASIDDANYHENVKMRQSGLQKTVDGIIHALSVTIEAVDPYTAVHQQRVAELAAAIGRQMGLAEWQTMGVRVAGLLHDVGKVTVPPAILNKPGKLDPYELNIIRKHSRAGYDILKKIEFPWPIARSVLQHHERLDGSGYPLGLAAEDIGFEARVLAVADVVEAMASHRPYRPSLGLEAALGEISRASGILYDAEVVGACLALLLPRKNEFDRIMAAAGEDRECLPEPVHA